MRWIVILAVALGVGLAAPFASSSPDGLERVAADQGFLDRGTAQAAPVPDYGGSPLVVGLSGFAGTLLVGLGGLALVRR
jgi:hypothetical protein